MITEYADVLEVQSRRVKVSIRNSSGCGSCSAKAGCGNGILDSLLNPKRLMWIDSDETLSSKLNIGDEIQIGVEEGAFVRNALSLYFVPVLTFIAGAAIGYQFQTEAISILGGIAGLILGSAFVRYLIKSSPYAEGFSPQIIDSSIKSQNFSAATEFNPASVNNS